MQALSQPVDAVSQRVSTRIVHLSSAHRPDDSRIFWKECLSLARAGYDVFFVVPDDRSSRAGLSSDVNIVPVKRRSGRLGRMLLSTADVVVAGLRQKAAIYHIHDPELIPGGLALRLLGKRVIYDVHEDLPRDILFKNWIPSRLRRPVSRTASALEWLAARAMSGIVAATPTIARRFPQARAALVQNFARLAEFPVRAPAPAADGMAIPRAAYIGWVTPERCAIEMVEAIALVERFPEARLIIGGDISPPAFAEKLSASPGWARVDYRGHQSRTDVQRMLAEAQVGLAIFHPVQSYIESQPVKLFEYMAAGLPVIAADFPHFRKLVEDNRCGLCVPPRDTAAIASALEWIFDHPTEAQEMGRRGRALVLESFNWEREAESLFRLYDRILGAT
jgi:glycosyltransferase involved in cell wall biosynthesis